MRQTGQLRSFSRTRIARIAISAAIVAGGLAAQTPGDARAAERRDYIVTFERGVSNVERETNQQEDAGGFNARLRFSRVVKGFAARLTAEQVAELRTQPDVSSVLVDEPVRIAGAVPLAAGEPLPPAGVRRVGAATAASARQRSSAGVAVLDTGIDLTHPDLNAADGINCVSPGESAEDDHGHGTHVAGTVAARNDGAGVVGVAPGTRVHAVKVMNGTGQGTQSQIICGLDWVAEHAESLNIRVANMSFTSPGTNDGDCGRRDGSALHAAICRLRDAGVVPVASAGNDGVDLGAGRARVPAAYPEVVTVTAMSDGDQVPNPHNPMECVDGKPRNGLAAFSNFAVSDADRAHTVAAPGVCIRSTAPGGDYTTMTGTSAAAPHVAGIAALCFEEGGTRGPCSDLPAAARASAVLSSVKAAGEASPSSRFAGDPLTAASADRHYGVLARVTPDLVAPETVVAAAAGRAGQASFTLSSPDAGARFECRVGRGSWTPCKRRHVVPRPARGVARLQVRAVDAAGNQDGSPATQSVRPRPAR